MWEGVKYIWTVGKVEENSKTDLVAQRSYEVNIASLHCQTIQEYLQLKIVPSNQAHLSHSIVILKA